MEDATDVQKRTGRDIPGFDPRARGGRDCYQIVGPSTLHAFRSARPWRTRLKLKCRSCKTDERFDPRARGGRDDAGTSTFAGYLVSIRAPVEDATKVEAGDRYVIAVSIRAPVEDATREYVGG